MKSFIQYISEVKHPRRVHSVRRGKAKQPSQARESDWPPFVPEPPGTTTSTGVAEEQEPNEPTPPRNEPTPPRNATPLPKSDPPPKKKAKPSKSVSDSSTGFLGLSSGLPPTSSQPQ